MPFGHSKTTWGGKQVIFAPKIMYFFVDKNPYKNVHPESIKEIQHHKTRSSLQKIFQKTP